MDQSLDRTRSSYPTSQGEAVKSLLTNLEGYFGGQYNQVQRRILVAYFMDIDPRDYDPIYAQTLRTKLYGRQLPLVEHFEEARAVIMANMPEYPEWKPLQIEAESCMDRSEMANELDRLIDKILGK